MKKIIIMNILIYLFSLVPCHLVQALGHGYLDYYQEVCKEAVDLMSMDTKALDQKMELRTLDEKLGEMITTGVIIAQSINVQDPKCRLILDLFIKDIQTMQNLSFEEIKVLYHEGGIIQKKGLADIDPKDDKYKECMEITHLMVHPITAQILFKLYNNTHDTKQLSKAKEELGMLYSHLKNHEEHN